MKYLSVLCLIACVSLVGCNQQAPSARPAKSVAVEPPPPTPKFGAVEMVYKSPDGHETIGYEKLSSKLTEARPDTIHFSLSFVAQSNGIDHYRVWVSALRGQVQ